MLCIGAQAQNDTYSSVNQSLTEVPDDIPGDVRVVDLSINSITTIKAGDFAGLSVCEELDLSNNQISVIESGGFKGKF